MHSAGSLLPKLNAAFFSARSDLFDVDIESPPKPTVFFVGHRHAPTVMGYYHQDAPLARVQSGERTGHCADHIGRWSELLDSGNQVWSPPFRTEELEAATLLLAVTRPNTPVRLPCDGVWIASLVDDRDSILCNAE